MGQEVSNEGILGVDSIRIGGMKPDDLPIREGALTAQQMPSIREAARKNTIDNIKASYPTQSVAWVKGAIRECEATITNVRGLKIAQDKMISDYSGHISLCAHRDREIGKLDPEKDADLAEIKKLKLQFPPFNVKAMKVQIELCKEAIARSDIVIDKEHSDIADLRALMQKCLQRDALLKPLGALVE